MPDYVFIVLFTGVLFIIVLIGFVRIPFLHRDIKKELQTKDNAYEIRDISPNVKLEKVVGKLVRKVIDKERVIGKNTRRIRRLPYTGVREDFYWKYYLTFETFNGYKSFTVTKKEYHKYSKNTYGFIFYQKKRFSHFEVHTKEDLEIEKHIHKNKE